ncbi:hypothetical protein GCM10009795_005230 [Nocardioides hankookensis]|uniref:Sensor histidine kinase n=1 Tax=Nocardioides hankookensis TaxID=443157 RepID=A0ABW1LMZ2_9ACTN
MSSEEDPRTGRRLAAHAIWATAWALTSAALIMAWWHDLPREPPEVFLSPAPQAVRNTAFAVDVAAAFVYAPVSALIVARRPHPAGIVLALMAVGSAAAAFGIRYGQLAMRSDGLPLEGFVTFLAGWAFVPGTFAMASLPLMVRRDRLPGLDRFVVLATIVMAALATLASMTQVSRVPGIDNPWAIHDPSYQGLIAPAYETLSALAIVAALSTTVILALRYRRGSSSPGQAWLLAGHLVLTLSYLAMALPESADSPAWLLSFALIAPAIAHVVKSAAILVVVLGQRLWGVAFYVDRAIVWTLLSSAGVIAYLVVVAVMSALVPNQSELLLLVVVLMIAAGALPLRRVTQRLVDDLVYGEGADPTVTLSSLSVRLDRHGADLEGLRIMCGELQRALRLGHVAVRARTSGDLVVSVGAPRGGVIACPIRIGEHIRADLEVSARAGERLDTRTAQLVEGAVGYLAAAWQLMESTRALDRAREELIEERAAVRRIIRRDLHDGLGPALTGAKYALAAIGRIADRDPAQAISLLFETADGLDEALSDVEALTARFGQGDSAVVDLAEALRELAARFATSQTNVVVSGGLNGLSSREVVDATRLVAAEALSNAVRHSGASRVGLDLRHRDDGCVELIVTDNGHGMIPAAPRGVGLASMHERASDLGGTLEIVSSASGTSIHFVVPADAPDPLSMTSGPV